MDELYIQLTKEGKESVSALTTVLNKSQEVSALHLYAAAGVAMVKKRIVDAGFLFYIARIRAQFDKSLFPPTGTGGDSPMVAFGALQQEYGSVINPELMADRKAFTQTLDRVQSWNPKVPAGYEPGWEYSKKGFEKDALNSIQDGRKKFMEGMGHLATLMKDDTYFSAFKTVQDYNLKSGDARPSKEAYENSMKTIERIETEKGIQVVTKRK